MRPRWGWSWPPSRSASPLPTSGCCGKEGSLITEVTLRVAVRSRPRVRRRVAAAAQYVGLGLIAVVTTFPFLWLLATSLRSAGTVFAFPPVLIPRPPTLANYVGVWETM